MSLNYRYLVAASVACMGILLAARPTRAQVEASSAAERSPPASLPASDRAAADPADRSSPLELFKAFLSSPPVVESLVFSERLPPDPKAPWRLDLSVTQSVAFKYYEARWQPGAFFLREIASPGSLSDPRTPGILAAHFGAETWFHDSFGDRARFLQLSSEPGGRLHQIGGLNSSVLRQVLTLGLMHSEVGSVLWQGDRFSVRNPTRPTRITGRLRASSDGLPESLHVNYSENGRDVYWVIRYAFADPSPSNGLPSLVRCFWVNTNRAELQRLEFSIYDIKTRAGELGSGAFSAANLASSNRWQLQIVTSNAIYSLLPDGKLEPIWRVDEPFRSGAPGEPSSAQLATVYTIWAGVNASIFVLAVRMRKQIRQNYKNKQQKG